MNTFTAFFSLKTKPYLFQCPCKTRLNSNAQWLKMFDFPPMMAERANSAITPGSIKTGEETDRLSGISLEGTAFQWKNGYKVDRVPIGVRIEFFLFPLGQEKVNAKGGRWRWGFFGGWEEEEKIRVLLVWNENYERRKMQITTLWSFQELTEKAHSLNFSPEVSNIMIVLPFLWCFTCCISRLFLQL